MKNEMSIQAVYSLARSRVKRSEFPDEGPFCVWLEAWEELNGILAIHDPLRLAEDFEDADCEDLKSTQVWARLQKQAVVVREALQARKGKGRRNRSAPRRPRAPKRGQAPSVVAERPAVVPPGSTVVDGVVYPRDVWAGFPGRRPPASPVIGLALVRGAAHPPVRLRPGQRMMDGVAYPRDAWEGFVPTLEQARRAEWLVRLRRWLLGA